VSADDREHDYFLQTVDRKARQVAKRLLHVAVRQIPVSRPREFTKLALDNSPTKRYGPKVQLAGWHRNPMPGPAGAEFL
jgi:hypothetical protein